MDRIGARTRVWLMIVDAKETQLAVEMIGETELTNKTKDKDERWNPFFC